MHITNNHLPLHLLMQSLKHVAAFAYKTDLVQFHDHNAIHRYISDMLSEVLSLSHSQKERQKPMVRKKKHECTRKLYSLRRLDTDTKQLNVSTQNVFISNTQKEDRLTKKDRRGETVNEMKRR